MSQIPRKYAPVTPFYEYTFYYEIQFSVKALLQISDKVYVKFRLEGYEHTEQHQQPHRYNQVLHSHPPLYK